MANRLNPPHHTRWSELLWPREYPLAHYEMSFLLPHLLQSLPAFREQSEAPLPYGLPLSVFLALDAGALGVNPDKSHKYLDDVLIPFFESAIEGIRDSGITECDCGQGIAQATLVAYEEGLGTCVLAGFISKKLKRVLELPPNGEIMLLQTVGYPMEDPDAGGQRPKLPFEQKFSLNKVGNPFPRSEAVVQELKDAKMLCDPAPLDYRREELQLLQGMYGLTEVFGDEIPGIIKAAEEEAKEDAGG